MVAINAYWAAVERPEHDHRRGAAKCPCCTTADVRVRDGVDETTQIIADIRNGVL